jgi:hypothetical protein
MSGLRTPLEDILKVLSAIKVVNADNQNTLLYARLWNNQLRMIENGKSYEWPRPAAFVEVITPVHYEILGLGLRMADLGIKIHLIHDFYNQDDTFDQDLVIFDLRDKILASNINPANPGLSGYCLTSCGPLNCINETQDSDHDNLVHYILDFVCNFIDSKASPFDDNAGNYDDTADPNLDVEVDNDLIPTPEIIPDDYFILPVKN